MVAKIPLNFDQVKYSCLITLGNDNIQDMEFRGCYYDPDGYKNSMGETIGGHLYVPWSCSHLMSFWVLKQAMGFPRAFKLLDEVLKDPDKLAFWTMKIEFEHDNGTKKEL